MNMKEFESFLRKSEIPQVQKIIEMASSDLTTKKAERKDQLAETLRQQAKASGFDIEELYALAAPLKAKAQAKYRNPDNPTETWGGHGRVPNWMATAVSKKIRENPGMTEAQAKEALLAEKLGNGAPATPADA